MSEQQVFPDSVVSRSPGDSLGGLSRKQWIWAGIALLVLVVLVVAYRISRAKMYAAAVCSPYKTDPAASLCRETATACRGDMKCLRALNNCTAPWGTAVNQPTPAAVAAALAANPQAFTACRATFPDMSAAAQDVFRAVVAANASGASVP